MYFEAVVCNSLSAYYNLLFPFCSPASPFLIVIICWGHFVLLLSCESEDRGEMSGKRSRAHCLGYLRPHGKHFDCSAVRSPPSPPLNLPALFWTECKCLSFVSDWSRWETNFNSFFFRLVLWCFHFPGYLRVRGSALMSCSSVVRVRETSVSHRI